LLSPVLGASQQKLEQHLRARAELLAPHAMWSQALHSMSQQMETLFKLLNKVSLDTSMLLRDRGLTEVHAVVGSSCAGGRASTASVSSDRPESKEGQRLHGIAPHTLGAANNGVNGGEEGHGGANAVPSSIPDLHNQERQSGIAQGEVPGRHLGGVLQAGQTPPRVPPLMAGLERAHCDTHVVGGAVVGAVVGFSGPGSFKALDLNTTNVDTYIQNRGGGQVLAGTTFA
jgi:hypothetical protein